MWPRIVTNFFIIKPNRCTNFTNLFWHETLHVSDSTSVHHQEFIHCTLSSGIYHTAFEKDQDGTAVPTWSCSKVVYKLLWHIPLLSLQWKNSWWWTEELSETCKVSCQNKFVKLVDLVGFIIKKFFSNSRTHQFQIPPRILPTQLHLMPVLRMSDRHSTQRRHVLDTVTSALLPLST